MNQLTALFMQQLSDIVPQSSEIIQQVRSELEQELERRLPMELNPGTFYSSGEGVQLKEHMVRWTKQARQISRPSEAINSLRELNQICEDADRLHKETLEQLRTLGRVDEQRLHYFYMDEQRDALGIVNEMIQIDLYRILTLGGVKRFRQIPALTTVSSLLADRIRYYKEIVSPALRSLDNQQKYGYWTIQRKEECHAGPMGILPLYFVCSPLKRSKRLIPGEYEIEETVGGTVYQGSGCLTNITPQNILQVQTETIYDSVEAVSLEAALKVTDPIGALKSCFPGKWYAIDPYDFFSMASMLEISGTLIRRGQLRQCCYCGSPVEHNVPLCPKCIKRIRTQ